MWKWMYEWYSIRVPNKHFMMFNQFLKSHLMTHFFSSFFGESLKIAPKYRPEGWTSDNLVTLGPRSTVLSLHNPKKGRAVTDAHFIWRELFQKQTVKTRLFSFENGARPYCKFFSITKLVGKSHACQNWDSTSFKKNYKKRLL